MTGPHGKVYMTNMYEKDWDDQEKNERYERFYIFLIFFFFGKGKKFKMEALEL